MRQRFPIALAILFAALACGSLGPALPSQEPPSAVTSLPTQDSATTPPDLVSNDLPSAGRLAVQGVDGNLYVIEKDRQPIQIASDGIPLDKNNRGRVYAHPSWSPQGWLSYVRLDTIGDGASQLDVMGIPPDESSKVTILSLEDRGYIYGYWSPAACSSGDLCGRFAFLVGENSQIALHVAEVTRGRLAGEKSVGLALPFYFSWSPDGTQMLWHRNANDLTVYDAENEQIGERLPDTAGLFQSPAWSPSDDRWLFARIEHEANQLTIAQDAARSDIGSPASQPVFFNWSPDGDYVASAVGEYPLSDLAITRADASTSIRVSELEAIVGFFWSPDSSMLAVVTVERGGQALPQAKVPTRHARVLKQDTPEIVLVWSVVDVPSGEVARLGSFFPTAEEFYILRYFDQYAQSHRVWSPDSRYLAYAERRSANAQPLISLLDVLAPGQAPIELMNGVQAVYSFEE